MYFCGYFVLSYVPNWEAICIVPIFGLVFGKIWLNASPRHDHIYVTPHCFTIKFEEAPSCFVLNAFLFFEYRNTDKCYFISIDIYTPHFAHANPELMPIFKLKMQAWRALSAHS